MELKLATWNLERPWQSPNGVRARRLRRQIAEVAADLWVLTETAETFTLPGMTSHWSSGDNPPPKYDASERAVAIHVRADWPVELVAKTQLCVAVRVAPPGASPLLVVGHLIPYRDAHDGPGWRKHAEEIEESIGSWRAWRSIDRFAGHRMLVAGDFNMTLHDGSGYGTEHGRRLIRQALEDCALRCVTAVDIRRLGVIGIERDNVDHLFVDAELAPPGEVSFWSGRAPDGPMSDHNGAVARLAL